MPRNRKAVPYPIKLSIKKDQKFICSSCKKTKRERDLEIHHIIPLSQGGSNEKRNLVALCRPCHRHIHCSSHSMAYIRSF